MLTNIENNASMIEAFFSTKKKRKKSDFSLFFKIYSFSLHF